jgi:hypothetical protein
MSKTTKYLILIYLVIIQIQLFQSAVIVGILADESIKVEFSFGIWGAVALFFITFLIQIEILKIKNTIDTK